MNNSALAPSPSPSTALPELVEGLSFFGRPREGKERGFVKLSLSGSGGLHG